MASADVGERLAKPIVFGQPGRIDVVEVTLLLCSSAEIDADM